MSEMKYTGADALNDALVKAGVSYAFVNLGTDYPPIIESWAKHEALGQPMLNIITAPHEYAAVSAAQGFAQVSGKPQAVFVHVDVGTQNMGGAIHNAFRCRVPMFVFAGLSPFTMEGEMKGSRDAYIQYIQNAADQSGVVRGYTKLCYELRTGKNIQQCVYRALQLAESEPMGPVYLTAAREPLEEDGRQTEKTPASFRALEKGGLSPENVRIIADALLSAKRPLVITSYLGRNPSAVSALQKLCHILAIPVTETNVGYMNYPADDDLYLGENPSLAESADVILCLDTDIPWPAGVHPTENCRVFSLDVDPVKEDIPLWGISAELYAKVDTATALRQLTAALSGAGAPAGRYEAIQAMHRGRLSAIQEAGEENILNADTVTACLERLLTPEDIVLNEVISYGPAVFRQLKKSRPGTLFASGGSSLGWFGGAAVGAKLAKPDRRVVALCSDGTFMFSCPTAVYWMAKHYSTPFLTVIYNNEAWGAPKSITRRQHPDGYAASADHFWCDFAPSAKLDRVAEAAGDALAVTVNAVEELEPALKEGLRAVDSGRCAVINVMLQQK